FRSEREGRHGAESGKRRSLHGGSDDQEVDARRRGGRGDEAQGDGLPAHRALRIAFAARLAGSGLSATRAAETRNMRAAKTTVTKSDVRRAGRIADSDG